MANVDIGIVLGAALWIDATQTPDHGTQTTAGRRPTQETAGVFHPSSTGSGRAYVMDHAFLGPEYPDIEIEEFLQWTKVPYRRLGNLAEETARLLV